MAPSCAPPPVPPTEENQQEAVASCLARLKPGHFQAKRLAFEIRDVGFTPAGSLATLQLLVHQIFDRATSDPERLSAPCAALCFSLAPILPTFKPPGAVTAAAKAKRIDFRQTLLNLCQHEFEAACAASFREPSGHDAVSGPGATSLSGSLQFLAYLYLHHLLTDRIMLSCLLLVASGGGKTECGSGGGDGADGGQQRDPAANGESGNGGCSSIPLRPLQVECLVKTLMIAGRQLDEHLAAQHRPLLDGLYGQLHAVQTPAVGDGSSAGDSDGTPSLSADLRSLLARLLDLRATGWATKNNATGGTSVHTTTVPRSVNGSSPFSSSAAAATAAAADLIPKGADGVVTAAAVRPSNSISSKGVAAGSRIPQPSKSSSPTSGPTSAIAFPGGLITSAASSRRRSSGGGSSAGPSPPPHQLPLRRGLGSSSASLASSRPSSQNLEGLGELTPESYGEVRGQLLAHSSVDSPATMEAMADDLVESAVAAACGELLSSPRGLASAAPSAGVAAGSTMDVHSSGSEKLSDDAWAAQVQRQWDEQQRACEIYVRLCVDALHQMGACGSGCASASSSSGGAGFSGTTSGLAAASVSSSSGAVCTSSSGGGGAHNSNGPAGGSSGYGLQRTSASGSGSPANGNRAESGQGPARTGGTDGGASWPGGGVVIVSDTARAFRRMLLSSAQCHFERCLAALLPAAPAFGPSRPASPPAAGSPASDTAPATPPSEQSGQHRTSDPCSPEFDPSSTSSTTSSGSLPRQLVQAQPQHAWADLPALTPHAAVAALPRARGMCHLLLGLLRHGVLTPRIVLHCAAALVDGAEGGSEGCLQCACILLADAGKQVRSYQVAEAAAFESLVKRLQGLVTEGEVPVEEASDVQAAPVEGRRQAGNEGGGGGDGKRARGDAGILLQQQQRQRRRFVTWLMGSLNER